jgi:uncharacterized protein
LVEKDSLIFGINELNIDAHPRFIKAGWRLSMASSVRMDITPTFPADRCVIQSYGAWGFRVSGQLWAEAVIVTPLAAFAWPRASLAAALEADEGFALWQPLLRLDPLPETILFGMGTTAPFIKPTLRAAWKAAGLRVDGMTSGAACRTYNVLLAEGRRVAAALLPPL